MRTPARRGRPAPLLLLALLLVTSLLAGGGPASASSSPPEPCRYRTSWVAGSTELCGGTVIYRDYVYDDYGADLGDYQTESTGSLSPTAGDERYPEGDVNTADLVRLTLQIAGSRLRVEAELNALFHPRSTVLAVAIDTDDDRATGGGAWGDLDVESTGWDVLATFDRGAPKTNVIRGSLPVPRGSRWRIQAVTAIRETGSVMNVAFRGVNERARFGGGAPDSEDSSAIGSWFEDDQAIALGTGDISGFGYEVNVADMRRSVTRAQAVGPGLHERVYTSAFTVPPGEGMTYEGIPGRGDGSSDAELGFEQAFHYLGRYQPYGIYIPHTPGPWGMQLAFHGTSANFSSLINKPGMQARFGEDLDRVLVVPEVRGPDGYASDISERDVLDVMADVEANYPIDRAREFTGGYSQGGYIAYRMAMLYPHRFAGAVSWVGFTGDGANGAPEPIRGPLTYTGGGVGNVIDFVGNLRWVPTVMVNSGADYLVHVHTTLAMRQAFAASDSPYTWYLYPAAEHLTHALVDDWSQEASDTEGLTRVRNPSRVTFRTAAFLGSPRYGIRHDRAYWVSAIRGRDDGYIDVDLTSRGCGAMTPTADAGQDAGVSGTGLPWIRDYRWAVGMDRAAPRRTLTGTLANVRSLRVDLRAACLQAWGDGFSWDITTDGPVKIWLTDDLVIGFPKAGRHQGGVIGLRPRR